MVNQEVFDARQTGCPKRLWCSCYIGPPNLSFKDWVESVVSHISITLAGHYWVRILPDAATEFRGELSRDTTAFGRARVGHGAGAGFGWL